jgi:curved DNA-binding protein CbpA
MNIKDALSILGMTQSIVTPADVKTAYRKACSVYHPDRNPAGLEMMKLVNKAFEALKDFSADVTDHHQQNYGEAINEALNAIITLGLDIEICGSWVWLSGNTKPHREALKTAGYKWAPKKMRWYFRPSEYKSFNRGTWSMDQIRETHGSQSIHFEQRRLAGCY